MEDAAVAEEEEEEEPVPVARNNNNHKRQKAVADDLCCPITLQLPFDPVMAEDGRVYERAAIERHIASSAQQQQLRGPLIGLLKSPMTNEPMGPRLVASPQIKNLIETLIENRSITGDLVDAWKRKEREKAEADRLLKEARGGGDPHAMYAVYQNYRNGSDGFPRDGALALQWVQKAHAAGSIKATGALGNILCVGKLNDDYPVERNISHGLVLLTAAAGQSNMAAYRLGRALARGLYGLPVDPPYAVHWLEKAVSPTACPIKHMKSVSRDKALKLLEELKAPVRVPAGGGDNASDDANSDMEFLHG